MSFRVLPPVEAICRPLGRQGFAGAMGPCDGALATPRLAGAERPEFAVGRVTLALALGRGEGAAESAPAHQSGFGSFSFRSGIQGRALSPVFRSVRRTEGR